jgi:hypothetical protein
MGPNQEEITMKRIIAVIAGLLLASTVALAQAAQPAQGGEMTKKSDKKSEKKAEEKSDKKADKKAEEKSAKKADKKAAKEAEAPKSDADIQKCITDKLAASEKLNTQGFSATVSNGEATLTGAAANAGSKGSATNIAKSCGAKSVINNITAPPVTKSAKKDEGKEEAKEVKKEVKKESKKEGKKEEKKPESSKKN